MSLITKIKSKLLRSDKKIKIVYPEGWNNDIVQCAKNLIKKAKVIEPILIFRTKSEVPTDLPASIKKVIIEEIDIKKYAEAIFEVRKNKGLTMN